MIYDDDTRGHAFFPIGDLDRPDDDIQGVQLPSKRVQERIVSILGGRL